MLRLPHWDCNLAPEADNWLCNSPKQCFHTQSKNALIKESGGAPAWTESLGCFSKTMVSPSIRFYLCILYRRQENIDEFFMESHGLPACTRHVYPQKVLLASLFKIWLRLFFLPFSSEKIVRHLCHNMPSCKLNASNKIFGDPCVGTYKYLHVEYCCD